MLEGSQLLAFLVAVTLLLLVGRLAGDLARRLGLPEVLGMLAAGVILGPSALGALAPTLQQALLTGEGTEPALSGLSNLGAVLLLLVAGLEVDLRVLRREIRPGSWVAATAIIPSLVAGVLLGEHLGAQDRRGALYLGVVMSVTAISVVSALLIESGDTRRRYAQVLLAGGVAGEVVVWVLVSAASAGDRGSPLVSGGRSLVLAVAFFAVAYLVGRRLVPAVMRRSADAAKIPDAPLTAVLVLVLVFAAITTSLGLHSLLGAFVFGVLLARAPRTNARLLARIEALTASLFAPIFFVLAGARVDLTQITTRSAVLQTVALFLLATAVKMVPVAIGARAGGIRGRETFVVATGMTMKGGTDVLVAILGESLGVLSVALYTQYTVVAIVTVLVVPPVLRALQRRVPASGAEQERLAHEEAERRSYLPTLERVLVPMAPALRPSLAADLVDRLARSADLRDRLIDVTQLQLGAGDDDAVGHGEALLADTKKVRGVRLRETSAPARWDVVDQVLQAAQGHGLMALGAPLEGDQPGTLAPLQNALIDASPVDVLLAAARGRTLPWDSMRTVLVPVNGSAHARAAAEIAAHLLEGTTAEIVLFTVVDQGISSALDRRPGSLPSSAPGTAHLGGVRFLLDPLKVRVREQLRVGNPATELAEELRTGDYDLVVMGSVDQPGDGIAWLGATVEAVVTQASTPYVLLISHDRAANGEESQE